MMPKLHPQTIEVLAALVIVWSTLMIVGIVLIEFWKWYTC